MFITSGASNSTDTGGVTIESMDANAGSSGAVVIGSGDSTGSDTGDVSIHSGASTSGRGGSISLSVGDGTGASGGDVSIHAGETSEANGVGGTVFIRGGGKFGPTKSAVGGFGGGVGEGGSHG